MVLVRRGLTETETVTGYIAPPMSPTIDEDAGKPTPFTPPEPSRFPRKLPGVNLSYVKRAKRSLWAAL